jgi:hypothetical protein
MTERYPYPVHRPLVERVAEVPSAASVLRWVIRDDNRQHHHGVVPLSPDPLFMDLFWKPDLRGREQHVGRYRLSLGALLDAGYVRAEGSAEPPEAIRLRFRRADRGVVVVQVNDEGPALAVGTVDMAG